MIRRLPEAPITDMLPTNVNISAETGMKIFHAKGIKFVASQISAQTRSNITTFNARIEGLAGE